MTSGHPFRTTLWSVVLEAGAADGARGSTALHELCSTYWYPLYAFLRRRGEDPERAADLVQGYFASLFERGDLARLERDGGRFRSWLLAGLRHHLADERDREGALKRGGDRYLVPVHAREGESRYHGEPEDPRSPEALYERGWAVALLEKALARLGAEEEARGAGERFAALRPLLQGAEPEARGRAAEQLELEPGALRVAVHRLRRRYRDLLREEVAQTLGVGAEGLLEEASLEEELLHLRATLAGD